MSGRLLELPNMSDITSTRSSRRQPVALMTAQRREALSRAAILAAMSQHASHAAHTLPSDTRLTLAMAYSRMLEMTKDDVNALWGIYSKTIQCQDEGCANMRSLHDGTSRGNVSHAIQSLDSSIPDDPDRKSYWFMSRFGLEFARWGDLRQEWRLERASRTVSDPSCLDSTMSYKNLDDFWLAEEFPPEGPNNASRTTLTTVDMWTQLEYDMIDGPSTGSTKAPSG